jgi:hypothetical protein
MHRQVAFVRGLVQVMHGRPRCPYRPLQYLPVVLFDPLGDHLDPFAPPLISPVKELLRLHDPGNTGRLITV